MHAYRIYYIRGNCNTKYYVLVLTRFFSNHKNAKRLSNTSLMSHTTGTKIENLVENMSASTEKELKDNLDRLYKSIHSYELDLYANDAYTEEEIRKIREWRKEIAKKICLIKKKLANAEDNKSLNATNVTRNDQADLEDTVRLVSREVLKTNKNILMLEKSTLKLKGLNYTSKDLEKEIEETKRLMQKDKLQEKKELYFIKAAIIVFISVCILILIDIFGIKRLI